jgi:hypothetical protein
VVAVSVYGHEGVARDNRAEARRMTEEAIGSMRAAIAAEPAGATVRIPNRVFDALPLPGSSYPGWAATFTIFFPGNTVAGRRVVFLEPRAAVRGAWADGRRTSTLLVAP